MILGKSGQKAIHLHLRVLQTRVGFADFGGTRHRGRQSTEVLRSLLGGFEDLLPFRCRRDLRSHIKHIGRRLLKRLLQNLALGVEVIDLVLRAEFKQLLGNALVMTALTFHLLVDLGDGLIAAKLVLFVGEGLDRLGIGIGQRSCQRRRRRPDTNSDQAGMTNELKFRVAKRLNQLLVGHRGSWVVRTVLLNNLRDDLIRTPVGKTGVEDFLVGRAELLHVNADAIGSAPPLRTTGVHCKFALRLVDGWRDTIDRKGCDKPDQQEDEH